MAASSLAGAIVVALLMFRRYSEYIESVIKGRKPDDRNKGRLVDLAFSRRTPRKRSTGEVYGFP